jgi:Phage integrase, N-terminal SAM-like domain
MGDRPPRTPARYSGAREGAVGSKLLDRLEDAARIRGYSPRTGSTYRRWVARYIRFHGLRHPAELNARHLEAFMVHVAGTSAPSTVNRAHSAVQFLYAHVLKVGDRSATG